MNPIYFYYINFYAQVTYFLKEQFYIIYFSLNALALINNFTLILIFESKQNACN